MEGVTLIGSVPGEVIMVAFTLVGCYRRCMEVQRPNQQDYRLLMSSSDYNINQVRSFSCYLFVPVCIIAQSPLNGITQPVDIEEESWQLAFVVKGCILFNS